MTNPNIPTIPTNLDIGVLNSEESPVPPHASIDERVQKVIDKFLYGGGRSSAQKIRNFLNGTWLGEPLHVVHKDARLIARQQGLPSKSSQRPQYEIENYRSGS